MLNEREIMDAVETGMRRALHWHKRTNPGPVRFQVAENGEGLVFEIWSLSVGVWTYTVDRQRNEDTFPTASHVRQELKALGLKWRTV